MRTKIILAALLSAALAGQAIALPNARLVEGESGTPVNAACASDGEVMAVHNDPWASGGRTLFFPHSGCSATYPAPLLGGVVSLTFANGGVSPTATVCGHFTFSGAITGSSASGCTFSDANRVVTVAATTQPGVGTTFTATWVPDQGTPSYANAFLDYMVVTGL